MECKSYGSYFFNLTPYKYCKQSTDPMHLHYMDRGLFSLANTSGPDLANLTCTSGYGYRIINNFDYTLCVEEAKENDKKMLHKFKAPNQSTMDLQFARCQYGHFLDNG